MNPYSDFWMEAISTGANSDINGDIYYKVLPIALNTETNIQNIDAKIRGTAFGEVRVANRTNLIDLKSSFGLNPLRDITGRIVVRESLLLSRGINARQVDLNNLANATYFVTLQGYNETQSKRLVIQK